MIKGHRSSEVIEAQTSWRFRGPRLRDSKDTEAQRSYKLTGHRSSKVI